MTMPEDLYYGPPTADNFCAYEYTHPGRRCPNHIDFYVKVPDGRGDYDWRKALAACSEHLHFVIWQIQFRQRYTGPFELRAADATP